MTFEVTCPACGGLIEADSEDELVELAVEHTQQAHAYRVSRAHVLAAAVRIDQPVRAQ